MYSSAASPIASRLRIRLSPEKVIRINLWVILALLVIHLLGRAVRFGLGYDYAWGFVPLSNLNGEHNFSSLYSTLLFFANSLVAALLVIVCREKAQKQLARFWSLASLVAAFLGCDEMLVLHEQLDAPMHKLLNIPAMFHYAWTIPYLLVTVLLGIVVFSSILRLPARLRRQLLIAGTVFMFGAVGCEIIEGQIAGEIGVMNLAYLGLATIEELLEMVGLTLSVAAMWAHFLEQTGGLEVS